MQDGRWIGTAVLLIMALWRHVIGGRGADQHGFYDASSMLLKLTHMHIGCWIGTLDAATVLSRLCSMIQHLGYLVTMYTHFSYQSVTVVYIWLTIEYVPACVMCINMSNRAMWCLTCTHSHYLGMPVEFYQSWIPLNSWKQSHALTHDML